MGKTAFLFPGQGSQYVGMAKDLFEKSEIARNIISEVEDAIEFKLSEIMFNGPMESLKQTDITQPAIFLHSVVLNSLVENVKPDMAAGHSLGEYSALVSAGALNIKDAAVLVRTRGEAMLKCGLEQPGTMAAVIGLEPEIVDKACAEASQAGIVQSANFNSPGQVVISGSVEGVRKAMEICKSGGAKLVKELVVSGAFHSPLMAGAESKLRVKLEETRIEDAGIPVYANVSATPVTSSADIKKLLLDQLTAPVRWEETIINMIKDGADNFIEIGPGKVLQGLVKRINRDVSFAGIDNFEDLERYL